MQCDYKMLTSSLEWHQGMRLHLMPALLVEVLTATSSCGNKAKTKIFCQIWKILTFLQEIEFGESLY